MIDGPYLYEKDYHRKVIYPIGNQVLEMRFYNYSTSLDTIYYNVDMCIYNKRKNIQKHFDHVDSTGLRPHESIVAIKSAFRDLEEDVLYCYNEHYNIVISVTWLDQARKRVYYRYLSRFGYQYGKINGELCIFKKYKKGSVE